MNVSTDYCINIIFSEKDSDAVHSCGKDSFTFFGCSEDDSAINILEWQANYAAACFLMPQEDVSQAFIKRLLIFLCWRSKGFAHERLYRIF